MIRISEPKPVNIEVIPGTSIYDAIEETIQFCIKYDCIAHFKFNGTPFYITKNSTKSESIKMFWDLRS